eukprot:TRINITY_DN524_c0_g2_i1.p1 TRINITY_DN524_c0_g2~~TRINITY_DN524_c0_g2_i1.p1  ORF type:complete len:688 (-),score=160.11 TRINITY_DN524_c0_g2_i1:367-2430(-)
MESNDGGEGTDFIEMRIYDNSQQFKTLRIVPGLTAHQLCLMFRNNPLLKVSLDTPFSLYSQEGGSVRINTVKETSVIYDIILNWQADQEKKNNMNHRQNPIKFMFVNEAGEILDFRKKAMEAEMGEFRIIWVIDNKNVHKTFRIEPYHTAADVCKHFKNRFQVDSENLPISLYVDRSHSSAPLPAEEAASKRTRLGDHEKPFDVFINWELDTNPHSKENPIKFLFEDAKGNVLTFGPKVANSRPLTPPLTPPTSPAIAHLRSRPISLSFSSSMSPMSNNNALSSSSPQPSPLSTPENSPPPRSSSTPQTPTGSPSVSSPITVAIKDSRGYRSSLISSGSSSSQPFSILRIYDGNNLYKAIKVEPGTTAAMICDRYKKTTLLKGDTTKCALFLEFVSGTTADRRRIQDHEHPYDLVAKYEKGIAAAKLNRDEHPLRFIFLDANGNTINFRKKAMSGKTDANARILRVYDPKNLYKTMEVDEKTTVKQVCDKFVSKLLIEPQESFTLQVVKGNPPLDSIGGFAEGDIKPLTEADSPYKFILEHETELLSQNLEVDNKPIKFIFVNQKGHVIGFRKKEAPPPTPAINYAAMLKRKKKGSMLWKKRWMTLRNNELSYYKSQKDTAPIGTLRLTKSVRVDNDIFDEHEIILTVPPELSEKEKAEIIHLSFDSLTKEEMKKWVDSIKLMIEKN